MLKSLVTKGSFGFGFGLATQKAKQFLNLTLLLSPEMHVWICLYILVYSSVRVQLKTKIFINHSLSGGPCARCQCLKDITAPFLPLGKSQPGRGITTTCHEIMYRLGKVLDDVLQKIQKKPFLMNLKILLSIFLVSIPVSLLQIGVCVCMHSW